jgi:hypothetical protein
MEKKEWGVGAGGRKDGPRHRRAAEDVVTAKEGGTGGRENQAPRKGAKSEKRGGCEGREGGIRGLRSVSAPSETGRVARRAARLGKRLQAGSKRQEKLKK